MPVDLLLSRKQFTEVRMSKMNFAYNPPQPTKSDVRPSLVWLGYLVLAAAFIAWIISKSHLP